ncbi:hypothetical protein E2C01_083210 [Portunus trituberculatus]|uniref:Uncharacterized protein n=1 Tax=Portunus trituberculatus TaxID=210409 RepID=A0A5B7J5U7_PORTR|nr:hypothetical protein [Portunus trituberculatus]
MMRSLRPRQKLVNQTSTLLKKHTHLNLREHLGDLAHLITCGYNQGVLIDSPEENHPKPAGWGWSACTRVRLAVRWYTWEMLTWQESVMTPRPSHDSCTSTSSS